MTVILTLSGVVIAFLLGLFIGAALIAAVQKQMDDQKRALLEKQAAVVAQLCEAVHRSNHDVQAQLAKADEVARLYAAMLQTLRTIGVSVMASTPLDRQAN